MKARQTSSQASRNDRRRRIATLIFLGAIAIRLPLLSISGFPPDQTQFVHWAYLTTSQGLPSVYSKQSNGRYVCNYPPGYVLVLRGLSVIQDSIASSDATIDDTTASSIWNRTPNASGEFAIRLHKVPAMLADAALAAMLFLCLRERLGNSMAYAVAGVYAISPAVLHDSCVWGQADAIHTLLLVLSVEAARRRRIAWMAFFATMAVLFKAQSVILFPLWAAVTWCEVRANAKAFPQLLVSAMLPAIVLLAPFVGHLDGVWNAYAGATTTYPFTHLNGFSAWFFSAPIMAPHLGDSLSEWYRRDDAAYAFGLPARTLGMLGLLLLWARVVVVLIRSRLDDRAIRWAVRMLPLGFFLLSTQMHERYLFPAIALWAWSATASARWWTAWVALSACIAANMMWVWGGPAVGVQTFLRAGVTGIPIGTTCAAILCVIAVASWFDLFDSKSDATRAA